MEEHYRRLLQKWDAGDCDRECSLQLLFFCWMHWADPPFITNLDDDPRALDLWHEIFSHFGGEESHDPEFLFVAGIMAEIFPYCLGEEEAWKAAAKRMKERSLMLRPESFQREHFDGRGEYGRYFAHQASAASAHRKADGS